MAGQIGLRAVKNGKYFRATLIQNRKKINLKI
jgi:hypothetical protein